MGKVKFRISDATLQRERDAECNGDTTIAALIDALLPQLDLPVNLDGPLAYSLRNDRTGQQLPSSSFVQEVMENDDRVTIMPEIVPGGTP